MDLRKIKKLIDLLEASNLAELEIKEGEEIIRLSRIPKGMVSTLPIAGPLQPAQLNLPAAGALAPASTASIFAANACSALCGGVGCAG